MKRYLFCPILILILVSPSFSVSADSVLKPKGVVFSYVANLPSQSLGLNLFFLRGCYLTFKYSPTSFDSYNGLGRDAADYWWIKSPESFTLTDQKDRWGTIGLGLLRQIKNKTFVYIGSGLVFHSKYGTYCLDTETMSKKFHLVSTVNLYKMQTKRYLSINVNGGFLLCLDTNPPNTTGLYLIVGGNSNPVGVDLGLGLKFR